QPKPWAMGQFFVMPAIGSRHVTFRQRSTIGHREDPLKLLDFGNGLFRFHPLQSSSTGLPKVKLRLWIFPVPPQPTSPKAPIVGSIPYEQQRTISIV
ncbi:MAG TPA: hypothetical protein VGR71_12990, partial [Nitrospira sp.]|nr:hypothetical protein [Nitrospira sp.]